MEIFSESPKSFTIDRKSSLASKLKSSISRKLLDFLGDYTDDVLADYITVLICNGKHQNQAKDDLEAFLGERSGEFVSWLWDLLAKCCSASCSANGLPSQKDHMIASSSGHADRGLRSNRLEDLQNNRIGNIDASVAKIVKLYCPSTYANHHIPSNDMELSEMCCKGSVATLNGVNINEAQPNTQRSATMKEVGATKSFHGSSLTRELSGTGDSFFISSGGEKSIQCVDKSKKIVDFDCDGFPDQLLYLPKREKSFNNLQSSIAVGPCTGQICAANVSPSFSPSVGGVAASRNNHSRVSVWDRLGKPCENSSLSYQKAVAEGVDIPDEGKKVIEHTMLHCLLNEELSGRRKDKVNGPAKSCSVNNPDEDRKMEQDVGTVCSLLAANGIKRKGHSGGISAGMNPGSVSLMGQSSINPQHEKSSRVVKRSKLTSKATEAATPALVLQVQDVKKRFQQVESEMSKLRCRQLEIKKDGQPNVSSNSGAMKHSEEDVESRSVFVTNVHFAATKEALSMLFAKCGVVCNIVNLSDKLGVQPKGSAYITFASKGSVDKAVALSGTSFFSRTLKVVRKGDEAAVAPAPPQFTGKPPRPQFSHSSLKAVPGRPFHGGHLQWRREPVPATSRPSASTNDEGTVTSSVF